MNPLLIAAGGALVKGIGSFFGKKGKQKDDKRAGQAVNSANAKRWQNSEAKRIANLRTLQAAAAARGVPLNIPAELFNTMPDPSVDATQLVPGTNFWGDALSGIGQTGINYGVYKDSMPGGEAEMAGPPTSDIMTGGAAQPPNWIERLLDDLERQKRQPPGPWAPGYPRS